MKTVIKTQKTVGIGNGVFNAEGLKNVLYNLRAEAHKMVLPLLLLKAFSMRQPAFINTEIN